MIAKTADEVSRLREGGRRLARVVAELEAAVKPGLAAAALDLLARRLISAGGDRPSFLNYQPVGAPRPYPSALCVSINEAVVHGLPGEKVLTEGDLVSLDLGLEHAGLFTDMAVTAAVGKTSAEARRLLQAAAEALQAAVAACVPGGRLGDIGAAIEAVARRHRLGLVRELGGHGVGRAVHEEPLIANYGPAGRGPKLAAGMVLAIEPMFTLGSGAVKFLPDGYAVISADGALAAHFEHTVLITETGPEVITQITKT